MNYHSYHIDGKLNLADLLTKKHDIRLEDYAIGSLWQNGLPWMKLPTESMPLMKYSQLKLDKPDQSELVKECYQEPFNLAHCSVLCATEDHQTCTEDCDRYPTDDVYTDVLAITFASSLDPRSGLGEEDNYTMEGCMAVQADLHNDAFIVDMISHGWQKGRNLLAQTLHCLHKWFHRVHSRKASHDSRCFVCLHSGDSQSVVSADLLERVDTALFVQETKLAVKSFSENQMKKFVIKNGILLYAGRLDEANQFTATDLDTEVFFDHKEFTGLCPVVRSTSPLYFSYAVYVHMKVRPHSGVEVTLKEIMKKMFIPDSPRKVIKSIRNDCVKCRIMFKTTLELEMSKHHSSRTMLAPIFYNCQMDIVFGFKGQAFKRSRTTFKMYALVIVCLLTSATSILALEGMETQDVILAIERHSARHGVPAEVFVDNGSQLIALQSASFNLRNLDAYLFESLGMRVTVSSPKSHESRGRVEAKVKLVRSMLERTGVDTELPMTSIQWETMFSKVASSLDDLPMAKGNSSKVSDLGFDILTPNRLKLGRNNQRSLEGSIKMENVALPSDILNRNRKITSACLQILIDRIHHFYHKPSKWLNSSEDPPKVDDLVLFVSDDGNMTTKGKTWKLGRVVYVSDRHVRVMYPNKSKLNQIPTWKFVRRDWREISIILSEGDVYLNSNEYFDSIKKDAPDTESCRE